MYLTDEQQAILDGSKGETMAKVMKTLVMYGDTFHADKLVPVSSQYNHLVTSFGLKMMGPVFDLMQQLIDGGAISQQKFSVDPRPLDKNVPANFLQNFVFNNFMYSRQEAYEKQLVLETLDACGGSVSKAAGRLRLHKSVLYRKLEKYRDQEAISGPGT